MKADLLARLEKKLAVIHLVKIATDCIPHPDEFIISLPVAYSKETR